jgi:hypothetical protein
MIRKGNRNGNFSRPKIQRKMVNQTQNEPENCKSRRRRVRGKLFLMAMLIPPVQHHNRHLH